VLGTIATATGRPVAFSAVAVVAALLIAETRGLPSAHAASSQGLGSVAAVLRRRRVAVGMWLVALPAIASGSINVLGSLRLHRFGAAAAVIGATFLVAAAVEAVVTPAVGRLSDRRGRLAPLRYGLAAATAALCCFTLPGGVALLAVVIVVIAAALGVFWAPAMALLSDAAEAHGLDQGLAAALMNLAWAGGQILGSAGGGAIAKTAGDGLPMIVAASLCGATLALLTFAPRVAQRRNVRRSR
jgi:MFS family permease